MRRFKKLFTKKIVYLLFATIGVGGTLLVVAVMTISRLDGRQLTVYAQSGVSSMTASSTTKEASSPHATTTSASSPQTTTTASAKPTQSTTATQKQLSPASSPKQSTSLYANKASNVANQAMAWSATHPADAARMNRLAGVPMAQWFGDFSGSIGPVVNQYVSAAAAVSQLPVLVSYNIPQRDCGSYSSGGATSPAAYEDWIKQFAAGIGVRSAIVILEPDALAGMDCLSTDDQQSREQLLAFAVHVLRTDTQAAIYIDAGNSSWQSASVMAARLQATDISEATGFSLNVSNFGTTSSNIAFGNALAGAIGGKHFIVDTSRNGNGAANGADNWCNPDGRAFGIEPTLHTGNNLVDAYLWVKNPGESDGQCGSEQSGTVPPAAGQWWAQYALMLAQNSGW